MPRAKLETGLMIRWTRYNLFARAGLLAAMVVALALVCAGQPLAQTATPPETPAQDTIVKKAGESIARWTRVIERAEEQLNAEELSSDVLAQLRDTAAQVQKNLARERPQLAAEVDRIRKLVNALGPPPKEGEPEESEDVAAERQDLNRKFADADGALKQLDLLDERSRTLLASVSTAESVALGNRLLTPTPSLFSEKTWQRSARSAAVVTERAGRELGDWWKSDRVQGSIGTGIFAMIGASVLAAALLGWLLRRWLIRRYGRDPSVENPTYRMRVRAALAGATARTAIPIIVVLAAYGALSTEGFLFGFASQMANGIVLAVIALSILLGLPRSMLSPAMPAWRLAAMNDETAWHWYKYAVLLALLVALDVLIAIPASGLGSSPSLKTTYGFVAGSAFALVFLLMAADRHLWQPPAREMAASHDGAQATRSKWWNLARALTAIIAASVIVSAIAGYGILSDFIARRMLATAGAFLLALILHGLARDLVAILTNTSHDRARSGDDVSPLYVWTVLLLDIGLILTMAFLIVPLWGGQWSSVLDRFGWSLTGFKIGDRVFSLTDVLAGLVAFIAVIVVARAFQHFLSRRVFQQMRIDSGVRDSLNTAIGYAGLVIAAVIAVATAGVDLSGLALVAGALSVGVGFGLQSIVNNFVSGLILLAERPIKVGDWVQAGEHEGVVQRISVRSTEIKTFSRASVIVPNSELISNSVINWMHRDRTGRIEIPIGVGYDSDVEQVRAVLEQCAYDHANVSQHPEPHVLFMDFGDNALIFELRCFVADVSSRLRTASEIRFAINAAFRDAGISIPYPQRDLHIKEVKGLESLSTETKRTGRRTRKTKAADKPPRKRATQIDPDD